MRALEWQRRLEKQRLQYGKAVLSIPELCNLSGDANILSVRVQLGRLVRAGIIERCANGRYGLPGAASPELLLPSIDPAAYMTGLYALFRHDLVNQVPTEIACFTNRRHNRSRIRRTSVATFRFVCVASSVYLPPEDGVLAAAEQALCDWVLMLRHRGADPQGQASFRGLEKLDLVKLHHHLPRYPQAVRSAVLRLLGSGLDHARSVA